MKPHIALTFAVLLLPAVARAEFRTIAVEVFLAEDKTVKVNIHSEAKGETCKAVSVAEAAKVLKQARGWGSSVGVAIVTDGAHLSQYFPLVQAIAGNGWLDLALLKQNRGMMGEQILRHYKIKTPARGGGR